MGSAATATAALRKRKKLPLSRAVCHMIPLPMSMRAMVLGVFLLGLLGTGIELLFLGHTAGLSQLVPLVLLVMSVLSLLWHALDRKWASLRVFQITMLLVVAGGVLGTALHYRANEAFEREADPRLGGMELLSRVMTGAAPALAPGSLIQLGLLGLVYTFQHPASERKQEET